jgi:hypothetical protein
MTDVRELAQDLRAHETNACVAIRAPGGDVRNCAWADDRQTLCDNPDCLADAACEGGERAIG